jgi:DNA polymerase III gamma/tau subunit
LSNNTPTTMDEKYRPKSLDEVIGNEVTVTTLKGFIKSGKFPAAIAFFGPPSAGKTTLSRAFARDVIGDLGSDYTYVNVGSTRGIDDMRDLVRLATLSPMNGKRRFIHLDEAQSIISSPAAAAALLAPLETPHSKMTWLLSSMSPEKFSSTTNGKAILSRSTKFFLKSYSEDELKAYATRIIKGEGLTFFTKELRDKVVTECGEELRTIAHTIGSIASYYEGLEEKPAKLGLEAVEEVLRSITDDDDKTAVRLLTCIYAKKLGAAQREILGITDAYGIISKMLNTNYAVLNDNILKGARHPKVWMTVAAKALKANLTSGKVGTFALEDYARIQSALIDLKASSMAFSVPEDQALFQFATKLCL